MLNELITILNPIIQTETGFFKGEKQDEFAVLIPINDTLELFTDNNPKCIREEVRISLFSKGNYISTKEKVLEKLLEEEFNVTGMYYAGYEEDTEYHNYSFDVEKIKEMKAR